MNAYRPARLEQATPGVTIEPDGEVTDVGALRIKWNARKTFGVIQEDQAMNRASREAADA